MRQSPGHITTEESTEALDLLKVWELVLRRENDGFEVGWEGVSSGESH